MIVVQVAITVVSIAGGALMLVSALRRLEQADVPLLRMVERRLAFTEHRFRPWIDNDRGQYRIHHPVELAAVTVAMFGIT